MLKKFISYFKGETGTGEQWAGTPYASGKDEYASPETVEQLIAVQTRNRAQTKEILQGFIYGGPGYTKETAWGLTIDDESVIKCESFIIRALFDQLALPNGGTVEDIRYNRIGQKLLRDGNRHYDVLKIMLKVKNKSYLVEQWFDITNYYNKL